MPGSRSELAIGDGNLGHKASRLSKRIWFAKLLHHYTPRNMQFVPVSKVHETHPIFYIQFREHRA
jgi:hypothetical protein